MAALVGSWAGPSDLWLEPDDDAERSDGTANGHAVLGGSFVRFDYSWAFRGKPQEGSMLIGYEPKAKRYTITLIDSWHLSSASMRQVGMTDEAIDVFGEYEVEGHPNWGWRTRIDIKDESVTVRMWNVSPEGNEDRAVEAVYRRPA
jgi:hypothetical protein